MSLTQDDYGVGHQNPEGVAASSKTEPADPSVPDHEARQGLPLAPKSVKVDRIPKPLTDAEGPLSVKEARESYLRTQRASWTADGRTLKYERHRYEVYPRILGADRHFQEKYDGLTTVMLTRRLSPLDANDNWLTPWECDMMLHGGKVNKAIRKALNYQLGGFEFEWIAVTAPTRSAGTTHEHIYLWVDDLENDIAPDNVIPVLGKHLKYCANAYQRHHRFRADGSDGAITVEHSPNLTTSRTASQGENTVGAQYLASQLAHLPIGDYFDSNRENPPNTLLEGAALAWASPHYWFRASAGIPKGLTN